MTDTTLTPIANMENAKIIVKRKLNPDPDVSKMMSACGVPVFLGIRDKTVDYCKETKDWIQANWGHTPGLLNVMTAIVKDIQADPNFTTTIYTEYKSQIPRVKALAAAIMDAKADLANLVYIFHTNKGMANEAPPISTAFNNMTYAERRKVMEENAKRFEEVPLDDVPKRDKPLYQLD